ncbi:MAG: hypothetical protein ABL899_03030 [Nitrospira sp.]
MYSPNIKYKVLELRKSGTSLGEIAYLLSLNKSTISYWCRDIVLKDSSIRKIKINGKEKSVQALLRYSELKRKERVERNIIQKHGGISLVEPFSNKDLLMVGLGLYWGEGYKESNGELGFTNSNPKIIEFYLKWVGTLGVHKSDLIFRLTINNLFKNDEKNIKNFWIDLLKIEGKQFSKTTLIKTKIKKGFVKDVSKYKGILRVKVRRGLALKNKILGAIDYISTQV